jgi:ABC-type polysaccharide/polyol phosphate transport system ATPase subunit
MPSRNASRTCCEPPTVTAAIRFDDVTKQYRRGRERINLRAAIPGRWGEMRSTGLHAAIDGLSFELEAGRSLGLIGPNGAGKSTTLKLVANVIGPTSGEVTVHGRAASLIELGAGFHPDMTGRENIYFGAAVLGMGPRDLARRLDDIVDFADIGEYLDTPVKRYSSGMLARLGFAVASHLDADILVLDEVLAVGDASFQRKCHARIAELRRNGAALLYVTHALWTLPLLCERAILLVDGANRSEGTPQEVLVEYERLQRTGGLSARDEKQVFRSASTSASSIPTGGAVRVTVDLELDAPQAEGHVLIILADPEERVIAATSSTDRIAFDRGGCHRLECELADLTLRPGSYLLHVGYLGDRSVPAVDEMRSFPLTVEGDPGDPTYGPLLPPVRWQRH